jgi:hypothetical protein
MSDLFNRILADKAQYRKRLATRSFSEKVAILEKLRDRSLILSQNPLRNPASRILKVVINSNEFFVNTGPSKPKVYFQFQSGSSTVQKSAIVPAKVIEQSEQWHLTPPAAD